MNIPKFKTCAGLVLPEKSIIKGQKQCIIQSAQAEEVRTYARELEACGFTLHEARNIPSGRTEAYPENLYFALTREDAHVFLFYNGAHRMALVSVCQPGALPPKEAPVAEKRVIPSVTQCKLESSGMCFAVQAADGSFILLDGGMSGDADTKWLYNFMKDNTPAGEKPRVALWLFTHPDCDHIYLATDFMELYRTEVDIEAVAYQFPDTDALEYSYQSTAEVRKDTENFEGSLHRNYPDAVFYGLHSGQVYRFPGVDMEILWTGDLLYPYAFATANDCSAVCRMRFENGKTALFMGDAMQEACRRMADTYGTYLKSDIFQVTHHGLIGGEKRMYQLVDPAICLWATSPERFGGKLAGQKFQWCIGEGECDYNAWIRDESIRKREHYHNGEMTTLKME